MLLSSKHLKILISCLPSDSITHSGKQAPTQEEQDELAAFLLEVGSQASAGAQVAGVNGSVRSAIANYLAALGIGATRSSNLLFSTANYNPSMPSELDFWAGFSYRDISGDVDGHTVDLTFGLQTEIQPDFLLGVLWGLNGMVGVALASQTSD